MLKRVTESATLAALFVMAPAAAAAQSQSTQAAPTTNTNLGDKNEKICENIIPVGTRLATKRFCGTRAEWEDRRRQDREAVENAQRSPCVLTHNSGSGRPAC
jgi:hypothetical protein